MSRIQVVRPLTVPAYGCDGPGCAEECVSASHHVTYTVTDAYSARSVCGWVVIVDPDGEIGSYGPVREAYLAFHSWRCLARWAFAKAVEHGALEYPEPPELAVGTASYGRVA